jgi:hypothetical protein
MNAASLINQTSGKTDFWTPQPIIEAARRTMGWINLDPASSADANKRVRANSFYTEADDGLSNDWFCKVFLNHPFSRTNNPEWINKLVHEYTTTDYRPAKMSEACCITFASTSEKWFKPLLYYPQCFLTPRTDYLLPDGTKLRGVTKGSVVTYLGPNVDRFAEEFKSLGVVKVLHQPKPAIPSPSGHPQKSPLLPGHPASGSAESALPEL